MEIEEEVTIEGNFIPCKQPLSVGDIIGVDWDGEKLKAKIIKRKFSKTGKLTLHLERVKDD